MRVLVSGITGYMGHELVKMGKAGLRGADVVCGVGQGDASDLQVPVAESFAQAAELFCGAADAAAVADGKVSVDVIVDFSHHSLTADLLAFAQAKAIPVVLATTGQTDEEREAILAASEQIPVFFAANFSLGVALLIELAKKTAAAMPNAEIEIIEKHHNRKLDAPSGTAIAIANAISTVREGLHAVCGRSGQGKRQPNDIGIHAVRMGNIVGEHEVLIGTPNETITLKHEAHDRALFAEGALAAAEFLVGKPAGMYNMTHLAQ